MKKIISTTTAFLFVASLGIATTATAASWNFKEDYLDRSVTSVSDSKKAAPERSMVASSQDSEERHVVSWNFDEGNFNSGAEVIDSGPATDRLAASDFGGDDARLVSWNFKENYLDRSGTTVSDSQNAAPERSMAVSSRDSDERHVVSWNFDEGNFNSGAEVIDSGPATDRLAASDFGGDDARLVSWNSDEGYFDSGAAALRQPADEQVSLSGTISNDNPVRWHSEEIAATDSVTFRAGSGNTFSLADNAKGLKLSDLDGRSVEIKGTVMERAGEKVIEVNDYNILN